MLVNPTARPGLGPGSGRDERAEPGGRRARPTHAARDRPSSSDRLLGWIGHAPWQAAILVTAVAGVLAWIATGLPTPVSTLAPHTFYVAIGLAATRFGYAGGGGAALAMAALAGPLARGPVDVSIWSVQSAIFVLAALALAWLTSTAREAIVRERDLRGLEEDLAIQRAALIESVSHEFRTPLTVVHGVAETFAQRPALVDPRCRDLIRSLSHAADRLDNLVSVVLAAGDALGQDIAVQECIDLDRLVLDVARRLGANARSRVRLDSTTATTIVTTSAHLRLLLRCVLDNAVRYSPPDQPIDVRCLNNGYRAVVEVRDHGPGVPEEFRLEAFDPFAQRSPNRGGLGLGLYSARRLAERLGGRIELENARPRGLVVRVDLPQRRETDTVGLPRG